MGREMTARRLTADACLIVDVDGTLTHDDTECSYSERLPRTDVIERVNYLHQRGVRIVIWSARNMRSFNDNLGLINLHTLPVLMEWLQRHKVCFDEIYMGKPWCGTDGFYVRTNGIRPDRFITTPIDELEDLVMMCSAHREAKPNDH
jgi:capsule biosynthesis phosphatase